MVREPIPRRQRRIELEKGTECEDQDSQGQQRSCGLRQSGEGKAGDQPEDYDEGPVAPCVLKNSAHRDAHAEGATQS